MLSNIHFVSNDKSKKNLQNFGIPRANVHNVGLLSLNSFNFKKVSKKDTFHKFNLDKNKKKFNFNFFIQKLGTWSLHENKLRQFYQQYQNSIATKLLFIHVQIQVFRL